MYNVHPLPQQDGTQHGHIADGCREDALIVAHLNWQIVDFQAVCHVPNAAALPIRVGQNNNLKQVVMIR